MNKHLYTLDIPLLEPLAPQLQQQATTALEEGQILFFPTLTLDSSLLSERKLWSENFLDKTHKNVSYHYTTQQLGKLKKPQPDLEVTTLLQSLMNHYAKFAKNLIDQVLPTYSESLIWGRTSFRPAKITRPAKSVRKDDTRLHVDSFSASPVYGKRILRVFTNINPYGEPRVWHVGEPFDCVLKRFANKIPNYNYLLALFLKLVKTTKTLRSPYDHYQIHLHDRMKRDNEYQQTIPKHQIDFPAHSTWIVFTDQTSHAALKGQFLLEQTFYLPVSAMTNPELSPLKQWEKAKNTVIPYI